MKWTNKAQQQQYDEEFNSRKKNSKINEPKKAAMATHRSGGILYFDLTWHLFIIIYFPVNWLKWKKKYETIFLSRHTIQIVKWTKHVAPSFSPRTRIQTTHKLFLLRCTFFDFGRDVRELVAHRKLALFFDVFDTCFF